MNLFAASTAEIRLDNGRLVKPIQTRYPWTAGEDDRQPDRSGTRTIKRATDGPARSAPGGLYRFMIRPKTRDPEGQRQGRRLNIDKATQASPNVEARRCDRAFAPMIRRVAANDRVDADRARVAPQRAR